MVIMYLLNVNKVSLLHQYQPLRRVLKSRTQENLLTNQKYPSPGMKKALKGSMIMKHNTERVLQRASKEAEKNICIALTPDESVRRRFSQHCC